LIYGTGTEAEKLSRLLSDRDYKVEYYLDGNEVETVQGKQVKSPFDIVYEDLESIFIIVAIEPERYGGVMHTLLDLGLTENIHFTYFRDVPPFGVPFHFDAALTINRVKEQLEGFEVFGDTDNPAAPVIVALGGSTTESELNFIRGWVYFLSERFKAERIPAVIYCGGVASYTSTLELIKLIRDVIPLQPDIVISYSGYNDLSYFPLSQPSPFYNSKQSVPFEYQTERVRRPFVHYRQVEIFRKTMPTHQEENRIIHFGLQNDKSASEYWLDNMRMMNAVANEYGITFLSFFQPFLFIGNYEITDSQYTIINRLFWNTKNNLLDPFMKNRIESMRKGASEISASIIDYDFITDLSHIFDGYKNIFTDDCHVCEQGNQIIAAHIYMKLKEILHDTN
jgi:lysophospholipase L1-like esterase